MNLFNEEELTIIGKELIRHHQTIAVAESATSGLLQYAFGSIENALQFYQGGITVYNIGQKYKHLSVEPIHALKVNCVSEQVVKEMAISVNELFKSYWGIGISGYATPVSQSDNKVYAYYAIARKKNIVECSQLTPAKNDSLDVQIEYANAIIERFCRLLKAQDS